MRYFLPLNFQLRKLSGRDLQSQLAAVTGAEISQKTVARLRFAIAARRRCN